MVNTSNGWLENHLGFQQGNTSSKGTIFPLPCKFTRRYKSQSDSTDGHFFSVGDVFGPYMLLVATWSWKEHRENDGWLKQINLSMDIGRAWRS